MVFIVHLCANCFYTIGTIFFLINTAGCSKMNIRENNIISMADQQNQEQKQSNIRKEIRSRTIGYIVGALGLVAGLAWNEAIRQLIDVIFPLAKNSIWIKFVYAIIITAVVVWVSMYLVRLGDDSERKDSK